MMKQGKDMDAIDDVINELLHSKNVRKINNFYTWNLITVDPDDNKFVDCAISAGAEYIVTNDKHFNVLKDISFPKVEVADMAAFKQVLRG